MNLGRLFRVNARPFKHCLYFICERKFYTCADEKITQQWKSTLERWAQTKKTTVKTRKWIFLEHWYWKINDICNGSGSLARTTRSNVTQLPFSLPSVDIGLCRFLLLDFFWHRFTHSLNAFFYALFISYTIFYSIYSIVQFLLFFTFLLTSPATVKINVYKLKRQEREICI